MIQSLNTYAFIDSQNLNMGHMGMVIVRVDLLRAALEYKPTKKTKISGRSKP